MLTNILNKINYSCELQLFFANNNNYFVCTLYNFQVEQSKFKNGKTKQILYQLTNIQHSH